jgi:hypothetical protein
MDGVTVIVGLCWYADACGTIFALSDSVSNLTANLFGAGECKVRNAAVAYVSTCSGTE